MDDQSGFLAMKALLEEKNDAIDSPKAADDEGDNPKNASSNESLGEVSNLIKSPFLQEKFLQLLVDEEFSNYEAELETAELRETPVDTDEVAEAVDAAETAEAVEAILDSGLIYKMSLYNAFSLN